MSKYAPLQIHLARQRQKELVLTFAEIEAIVGFRLPASADRPQWWANQVAPGRPQREAWRAASYDAFLMAGSRKVRFQKVA
jgi:hypothetical protein